MTRCCCCSAAGALVRPRPLTSMSRPEPLPAAAPPPPELLPPSDLWQFGGLSCVTCTANTSLIAHNTVRTPASQMPQMPNLQSNVPFTTLNFAWSGSSGCVGAQSPHLGTAPGSGPNSPSAETLALPGLATGGSCGPGLASSQLST